jgi:hypothetical protein
MKERTGNFTAQLCQRLQGCGECIMPYHRIIEELVKLHATRPDIFNWRRINVSMRELEEEVARPQYLNDDAVAKDIRADFRAHQKAFEQLYRDVRAAYPIEGRDRPVLPDVMSISDTQGNPHWKLAADIYETLSGKRLTEAETRSFVDACLPMRLLMLSACVALYHRCVRDLNTQSGL